MKNSRKPTLAELAASGVGDLSLMGKDAGIVMPRQSGDLPALAYIPPPQSESQMPPGEGQRSRSSSKANGTSPYATPWRVRTNSTTTILVDLRISDCVQDPRFVCAICQDSYFEGGFCERVVPTVDPSQASRS